MDRVDKILKAESDINDPENPKPIALTESICYRDVWFKYQHEWVLKGIDLTIPKGRTVALVGQSGSGKSTLVDLLPRFYDVDKGSITIDGTDVRDATLYDLRSLMGNVNRKRFFLTIRSLIIFLSVWKELRLNRSRRRPVSPTRMILSWRVRMDTIPISATEAASCRGTAPAYQHCTCDLEESADLDSRRSDFGARYRVGTFGARGFGEPDA